VTEIIIPFFNFLGFSIFQTSVVHLTHVRTGVCQATPLRSSLYSFTTVARRTCKVFSNIRFIFSIALYGKYIRKLYKIDTIFLEFFILYQGRKLGNKEKMAWSPI